jgi:sulfate adenylyltransferase
MTTAERGPDGAHRTVSRFFAEPMRNYVLACLGRPVSVLQAGCLAPLRELGIGELTEGGFEITVTAVDADDPIARRVLRESRGDYDDVITGDLRTVPIPQRTYDVVYCAQLLERVKHVALVLDRLNSALKPGGLLLIRTADRNSAAALLDRLLPGPARRVVWSTFRPGTPGPFPPVYEKAVCADGIADYALMRGLVIAARASELIRPDHPSGVSSSVRIICAAIAMLTRKRYDDGHDELLYVIRKPQDRFARVVLRAGYTQAVIGRAIAAASIPRADLFITPADESRDGTTIIGAHDPRDHAGDPGADVTAEQPSPGGATPRTPRGMPDGEARVSDMLPAELATWPAWTPGEEQLAELELLTSGAFAPLTGYLTTADLASVAERGELADGTPWPVLVTLAVPADAVPADAGHLVLQDHEGSPLAVLQITERAPSSAGDGALLRLAGPVTALRAPEHGPFRALRRAPAAVRATIGGAPVLALATRRPLGQRQIGQLRHLAGQLRARVLLLPLVAGRAELVGRPEALVRAVLAAARQLPASTLVVPVPLAPREDAAQELAARAVVAAAHGATHLLADGAGGGGSARYRFEGSGLALAKTGVRVITEGEWAFDPAAEVWRPLGLIEPGIERGELSDAELGELLDSGAPVPDWLMPAGVAAELRRARPPRSARGLVVFCTGLSGSGKSTLARDLRDALLERGDRTVSFLDGDLVRRLLSSGLTFSRADRDLNILRIGYVATEVARHGGIAICAPIAPYAGARAAVRAMVAEAGDFMLVHVATPLEVCETRDRKGLYAKARAGIIGSFTGISDPYEEPDDADLVIDTSVVSRQDAVAAVLGQLTRGGWLLPGGVRPRVT